MDKKDLIYMIIIAVLSIAIVGQCSLNKPSIQQDKQQENFTEALPKMGQ